MNTDPFPSTQSSSFEAAVNFLTKSADKGGIYGLVGSAPAFLIAAAVRKSARTIVVVMPDGGAALGVASDIRFFLGEDEEYRYPLSDKVMRYPSSDMLPFTHAALENESWVGRMSTLFRLREPEPPRVVVVGLDALIRKLIPASAFDRASSTISLGSEIDREELLERLVGAGYNRVPLVEDAGDFSVRGFIIDLYSPLYPYPIRIEQSGDLIESMRFFDPTNQRSRDDVPQVLVAPVHMLVPDEETRDEGLQRLLQACEDRGTEKRVRQRLIDDFRHGIRFPGSEFYIPYFFPALETLLDYVPQDSTLVLPNADILGRAFEDFEEEIKHGWENAAEDGFPVPYPDRVYLTREDFFQRIQRFRTVTVSPLEIHEPGAVSFRLNSKANDDVRSELLQSKGYDSGMSKLVKRMESWRDDGYELFLVSHTQGQAHRLLKLLEPYGLNIDYRGQGFEPVNFDAEPTPGIRLYVGACSSGFTLDQARRIVLCEEEIFGSRVRSVPKKRARGTLISSLMDLAEGEPVVHEDYGIGIYRGLVRKEFDGVVGEVMLIEYSGGDLLYHPVERLQVIQKYIAGSEEPPRIDKLGGKGWLKTKARIKKSIKEMAGELLEIYAKRQVTRRSSYSPPDENFAAFEASFDFEETPDQARAIQDVMESMDTDMPMDRLVCGDVGYGKTEVALRAAFRAIMDGRQVAVLVPTTVLAQQHFDTFKKRFRGYPFIVDVLSRFRSNVEQKETLRQIEQGKVDLVVGTHRLLQKDVVFKDLGLLVVDEEQRFGVAHKERVKKYKAHVDVLTLTATPIPRTLNLSLTGIRDLSVIETPPTNRQSIRTYVMRQSEEVVREALLKELNRGGQVFYVHNRVQSIARRTAALQKLVPEGRFCIAHGQMAERELEQVMVDFLTGKYNILVCTSIIESGLDIPTANTIVIERSDTFGLADLYQLRGRVGRSHVRAYAYLLTPPETMITPDAVKRLSVMQEYSSLGQGFRIAMRDMEIRGAGNILGTSQSGHVSLVGYEMYLDLLEDAIQELKGEESAPRIDPEIHLKLEVYIPDDYVPDTQQRMNLYKRLSKAETNTEIEDTEEEIFDLYGKPPVQVHQLIQVMRIRLAMKEIRVLRLDYNGQDLVLTFDPDTPIRPETLVQWAQADHLVKIMPGDRLKYRIGKTDPDTRIKKCQELFSRLDHDRPESADAEKPDKEHFRPTVRVRRRS
jgi:transcription-repair coupling factor (superfamily II helicase)